MTIDFQWEEFYTKAPSYKMKTFLPETQQHNGISVQMNCFDGAYVPKTNTSWT
jgi:hypothetical protein